MNKTLTEIIEDWIGIDKPKYFSERNGYTPSIDYIVTSTPTPTDGYNKSVSNLRSRIPELVELITNADALYRLKFIHDEHQKLMGTLVCTCSSCREYDREYESRIIQPIFESKISE